MTTDSYTKNEVLETLNSYSYEFDEKSAKAIVLTLIDVYGYVGDIDEAKTIIQEFKFAEDRWLDEVEKFYDFDEV